jgi:hypothetical protein
LFKVMPQLNTRPMGIISKSTSFKALQTHLNSLFQDALEIHMDQAEEDDYGIQNVTGLILRLLTGWACGTGCQCRVRPAVKNKARTVGLTHFLFFLYFVWGPSPRTRKLEKPSTTGSEQSNQSCCSAEAEAKRCPDYPCRGRACARAEVKDDSQTSCAHVSALSRSNREAIGGKEDTQRTQ